MTHGGINLTTARRNSSPNSLDRSVAVFLQSETQCGLHNDEGPRWRRENIQWQ
jgi:hypothetical protein